jgi:hypothetical protein
MRLVIEYTLLADCGGDSFTVSDPVIYECKETFLADFAKKLGEDSSTFSLGGRTFYTYHFKYKGKILMPEVFTIDEWFERCN